MIASLPMYDRPELRAAHDRFWVQIRDELHAAGLEAPATLTRSIDDLQSHWRASDLVLSQACGMPFRHRLHGEVTLVGTPDYAVSGCPPGYYCSRFVARTSDPRASLDDYTSATFAFNEVMSQSGFSAPMTHLEQRGLSFADLLETGGHIASALAVADGTADIAALDAVTWRLLQRHDDRSAALRVLESTDPTPGLPYITALGHDRDTVFSAIERAIDAFDGEDREALQIRALVAIPEEAYLSVPNPDSLN